VRVLAGAPFQFLRGRCQQCTALVMRTMPGQRKPEDRFQSRGRAPVARQPHKLEEVGSIPTPGTISHSPVAQIEERPILTREVDGANPSGAPPISWKSKRTSVPPPVGNRTELQPQLVEPDY
jgi:hypothetical protein